MLLLVSFAHAIPLRGEEVTLVKDIEDAGIGGYKGSPVTLNGYLYFFGEDFAHGVEIWKSDGTTEGTELFADIRKGPQSNFARPGAVDADYRVPELVRVGDYIFFPGNDGEDNKGLWKTDGTIEGTQPVKNFPSDKWGSNLYSLTDVAGNLYFTAYGDRELWFSDGTEEGTILYMEADAENAMENFERLTNVNGELFFFTNNSHKMWKTSGPQTAAIELWDFEDHHVNFVGAPNDDDDNGFLYFATTDGRNDQMWKTDGTVNGTAPVENPGLSEFGPILQTADNIFFVADSRETGEELWVTDGTDNGAQLFADVKPGRGSGHPRNLILFSGELFFTPFDVASGYELFRSDGTPEGTHLVKNIYPGKKSGVGGTMVVFGDYLYFQGSEPTNGVTLWRTDGTEDGTMLFHTINDWTYGSGPNRIAITENHKFFRAYAGEPREDIWMSDGTNEGTVRIREFVHKNVGTSFNFLTNVNGVIFFRAHTEESGFELWKTDGTPEGTGLVMDIVPGPDHSNPFPLGQYDGILYFELTYDDPNGELWRTDGTEEGTWAVKSTWGDLVEVDPLRFQVADGTLFFLIGNRDSFSPRRRQLWKSDGTPEGTEVVLVPFEDHLVGYNTRMKASGGQVFFYETFGEIHEGLWRTDGTAEGTYQVKDINPGPDDSYLTDLTDINGTLYFRAYTGTHGNELWRSDGTTEGTYMVRDIYPGPLPEFEDPDNLNQNIDFEQGDLVYSNGYIYFLADDGIHGGELWRTDGTEEGTTLVCDINPGPGDSFPFNVTDVNGEVYFIAYPHKKQNQLWKSDGTEAGTVHIANLNSAPGFDWVSHFPANQFVSFKDQLYFVNYRRETGFELYTLKRTEADHYFPLSVDIGRGWRKSDWLGVFFTPNLPWVWHNEHGWLYFPESESGDRWFWDLAQGWLWTSEDQYPLMYRYNDDSWLWYRVASTDPRIFQNYKTGQMEEIARSE